MDIKKIEKDIELKKMDYDYKKVEFNNLLAVLGGVIACFIAVNSLIFVTPETNWVQIIAVIVFLLPLGLVGYFINGKRKKINNLKKDIQELIRKKYNPKKF